jgi:hypothetical protein
MLAMANTWIHVLMSTIPPLFGVPPVEVQVLSDLVAQATATLVLAKSGDRSPVITAKCRADFDALENKMRYIKNHFFIDLSEADLISLGLKPHAKPSPVPKPEGFPEADVAYPGVHTLDLYPHPVAGQPALDPRSDYGYRIYWGVRPPGGATVEAATGAKRELMKALLTGDELPHSRWTRRRRERFDFNGDSGKTVYFCIRYENGKGEFGPWGPIFSAIIP